MPQNRKSLGVDAAKMLHERNFFYNEFVSKILYNPPDISQEEKERLYCKEVLKNVAIVEISFTSADAIVLERSLVDTISFWTNTGGLLSLYVGFSSLSLAEITFWVLRWVLTVIGVTGRHLGQILN